MSKMRDARERLKLTQSDVAREVGVSLVTYQLWERGVSTPKPENMDKLKKVLQIS